VFCGQCGNQVAEGSANCPRCGAPTGGGPPRPAGPSHAAGRPGSAVAVQGFNFDVARLSQADRIAGGASAVLLVSLFLPWFTASAGPFGGSASGVTAHGYLWVVFLLCLGIVAFLVLEAGFTEIDSRLPVGREMILLVATGLNLLLVLIAFFVRPNGFGIVSIGWGFGAFVGLIAAIAACVPLALPVLRDRSGR
jgi:tryptophan-rich sensory protein